MVIRRKIKKQEITPKSDKKNVGEGRPPKLMEDLSTNFKKNGGVLPAQLFCLVMIEKVKYYKK